MRYFCSLKNYSSYVWNPHKNNCLYSQRRVLLLAYDSPPGEELASCCGDKLFV